jgi:autotransporter-associated beta strand protein
MQRAAFALLLALAALAGSTSAATVVWTGNANSQRWSDTGNWQGGVLPAPGDRVLFGPLAINGTQVNNDAVGVSLDGIDYVDGGQVLSTAGNAITLTGPVPITVTSRYTYSIYADLVFSATSPTLQISGTTGGFHTGQGTHTQFAGGTVTLTGPGTATFTFESDISELATTGFSTTASLSFSGHNVYSGAVSSRGGTLLAFGTVPPFGTPPAPVSLTNTALLDLYARPNMTLANPLSLSQAPSAPGEVTVRHRTNGSGVVHFTGPMTLAKDQTFGIVPPGDVSFDGVISGAGRLTVQPWQGSGLATFRLNNPNNTFTGGVQVNSATLVIGANHVIPNTGPVVVSGGTLQVGGTLQSIESLSCDAGGSLQFNGGQIDVAGTVNLGNCNLIPAIGPTIQAAPIIRSNTAVVGRFNGLPEGANVGGLTLTYHGGPGGNDVVLLTPGQALPGLPVIADVQDMWWAGASENGWGMSLIQHGNTLFAALYIYDAGGNPTWLAMLSGGWDSTHHVYTGSLYSPTGTPFYAYDATHFSAGAAKGTITITFADESNATVDYTIGTSTGHKNITRQVFDLGLLVGTDVTDLWWGGVSQNGWGIPIVQQGSTLFPIWFTYGANGQPLWYFMPGGTWNAAHNVYSGKLYRATGSPWIGVTYDPTKLNVIEAGTYSITFANTGTTFTYSADGHTGSMPIVREPF